MSEETTFDQLPAIISFEHVKKQRVTFNPKAKVRNFEGRNGPFPAVLVQQDGADVWLPVSSARLQRKLHKLTAGTYDIERTGEGFSTDYEITPVKKAQ